MRGGVAVMAVFIFEKAKALLLGLLATTLLLVEVSCAQPLNSEINVAQQTDPATSGADAKVIARWNVVPFQSIDGPFNVGIVAFHINGIDRIEFQIDDGDIQTTQTMRHNDRTNTTEYWITVDPDALLKDGKGSRNIEISATAYPKSQGIPRKLESLPLTVFAKEKRKDVVFWVSESGSDRSGDGSKSNPFRQPGKALQALSKLGKAAQRAGDLKIYLTKGSYEWGSSGRPSPMLKDRWVTLAAAPGLKRGDVTFPFVKKARFTPILLKVTGVTIEGVFFSPASGKQSRIWIDDSDYAGQGRKVGKGLFFRRGWTGIYFTNMKISDVPNAATATDISRDVKVYNILSDAFSGTRLVVNSSVDGINRLDTKAHPDVYQIYCGNKRRENYIVYGLTATNIKSQGIFMGGCSSLDNIAIVNALIVRPLGSDPNRPFFSQWHTHGNHIILSGLSLPNSVFRLKARSLKNTLVTGSIFHKLGLPVKKGSRIPITTGIEFRHLHLVEQTRIRLPSKAIDVTYGNPGFENAAGGNFTPSVDSPLRNRVPSPVSVVDILGKPRKSPATIGAIE